MPLPKSSSVVTSLRRITDAGEQAAPGRAAGTWPGVPAAPDLTAPGTGQHPVWRHLCTVALQHHATLRRALSTAALLVGGAWLLGGWLAWHEAIETVRGGLEYSARRLARQASTTLDTAALIAARAADLVGDGDAGAYPLERRRQLGQRLRDLAGNMAYLRVIEVWDSEGRLLATSGEIPDYPPPDASQVEFFTVHKQPDAGLFIEPPRPLADHEQLIRISRRRDSVDGRFAGVVVTLLTPRAFTDPYLEHLDDHEPSRARPYANVHDRAAGAAGQSMALVRADSTVVAHMPPLSGDTLLRLPEPPRHAATDPPPLGWTYPAAPAGFAPDGSITVVRRANGWPLHLLTRATRTAALVPWRMAVLDLTLQALIALTLLGLLRAVLQALDESAAAQAALDHAQQQRSAAEDSLRHAQKLEAVGQLTGGVAHDFNNLMMVVNTNLHILRLKDQAGLYTRELMAIERAIHNGQSLTRQLMAFTRRRPRTVATINLADHLGAICDLARHTLSTGFVLGHAVAPGTGLVRIDPGELEVALLNLIVNARDAMPGGGQICISVRNCRPETACGMVDVLRGEAVAITVRDEGDGIPPALIPRIVEPFFTTKDPGKGTGLGLAQVLTFARAAGGTLGIVSPPESDGVRAAATACDMLCWPAAGRNTGGSACPAAGLHPWPARRGTAVTLYLPRADNDDPTAVARAGVLVAEADPAVGESIAALLEQLGYRARVVHTAAAVRAALLHGEPCDLLLLDVNLPGGMAAPELVRLVRGHEPDLQIVLTSSFADDDPCHREDGLDVLSKPFDAAALTAVLQRLPDPTCAAPANA